jgi:hypothetical protein
MLPACHAVVPSYCCHAAVCEPANCCISASLHAYAVCGMLLQLCGSPHSQQWVAEAFAAISVCGEVNIHLCHSMAHKVHNLQGTRV